MKSLSKYPVPFCYFHCPTISSSLGSLILGEQIVHIHQSEDQLALSNNKPSFKLTRVPLLLHNSVFLLHLPFLIFLSARKPPPQPPEPHFHCFFPVLLHHHHITVVFPPPPSFYCFHPSSSTTTTTTTTTFQYVLPPLPPHSNAYFSTNV